MSDYVEYTVRVYKNGDKFWFNKKDEYHRTDGPAIEYGNGEKHWYKNGKRHRLNGPSIEYTNGDKWWHQNGQIHRLDGPAIEYTNGDKEYWINDKRLTEEEFSNHTNSRNDKVIEIDGKKYKLISID